MMAMMSGTRTPSNIQGRIENVGEAGRPDLQPIRAVAPVRDEVVTHLTFRVFRPYVGLPRRDLDDFGDLCLKWA